MAIEVEDHTAGNDLSQSRAESIVAFLIEQGVSAERMTAVGKGPSEPVADAATPAGRVENRRVVFKKVEG